MFRAASGRRRAAISGKLAAGVESMADDARGNGDRNRRPTDEAALSARLQRLGERLGDHRPGDSTASAPGQRPVSDPSAIARGFRLSTELVAGVLVGAAIGWLLDRWLGISPWGMIVFLLLGFAAGVLNVMRAAGVVRQNTLDQAGPKE
jgi:ATP synthase protein I